MTSKLLCTEHLPSDHDFYFCFTVHLYKLAGAPCLLPGDLVVQIGKGKKKKGKQSSATVLGNNWPFMEVKFFPLSLMLDNLLVGFLFWFEETLGYFCLWGKIFVFQTVNSWKTLVSAGTYVTLAPLGVQVNSMTRAYMSSISYSVSRGRFEYTESRSRQLKSEISMGSSNPGAQDFSQSHFCWRKLMFNMRSRNYLSCSCWSTAHTTSSVHFKETNFQKRSLFPSGASSSYTAELSWKKNQYSIWPAALLHTTEY